jgi:hypothetical protein
VVLYALKSDNKNRRFAAVFKPSPGLEPGTASLPSSNDAGTAGKLGKPRARKPRKEKESPEDG